MHALETVAKVPGALGRRAIERTGATGRAGVFLLHAFVRIVERPVRLRLVIEHIRFIGNRSLGIIALTSAFSGMVLMLQSYEALVRFGSEVYVGPVVALSLIRELGPVLAALMVTARAGSAMTATIGSMRVTEQIDALDAMAVDPLQYLVSTRLLASLVAIPLLVALFDVAGMAAGYAFGTRVLGLDGGTLLANTEASVEWEDVSIGIWKSLVFAVLVPWVATYEGYTCSGGVRGVGDATTRAVVVTSVLILATDFVMTALLF